jgi:cyanophycinase
LRYLALVLVAFGLVRDGTAQVVGPEHGTLVLVGGGLRNPVILEQFLYHAGGPDARIVVIPTAREGDDFGDDYEGVTRLREAGATNATLLHARDRVEADSDAFARVLDSADAVWISGGRQWRLADAYLGTRTQEALVRLLDRGGVIGGSSAGATIQGSYLVRGDTGGNRVMMGDHQEGFGFLKNTAVDQHLLRRNRHFDLIEVIEAHPQLLGIGLDEDTAIVVRGDAFLVVGSGYVAIYDFGTQLDGGGRFYFLAPGDRFDLVSREATRGEGEGHALEGLRHRPWKP